MIAMLHNLDASDYALAGIAIVIAVYSLTVLMNRHRQKTIDRLRGEVAAESQKSKDK